MASLNGLNFGRRQIRKTLDYAVSQAQVLARRVRAGVADAVNAGRLSRRHAGGRVFADDAVP